MTNVRRKAEVPQLQSMQETASKFLFDNNSQSMMKFEEPMSFSPFNTRFSQNNFDLFINKYNASNHEDTYFFNNNNRSMSLKPAFSNLSMEKFPKSKFEENAHAILNIKDTPSTTSNKGTPNETKSKTIILQTSDTSNQKKKKMKKKSTEKYIEEDEKTSRILKHPISKLRKSKQPAKVEILMDPDEIFVRLHPGDLITKQLQMKLNNFPRLEIKTSKKNYLKKIVDHLREKWLVKLNSQGTVTFDIIIKPNQATWLKHLNELNSIMNLPKEETNHPLPETYMLSDVWSGYNEPASNKIDLEYEIKEVKQQQRKTSHDQVSSQSFKKETISRRPTGYFGGLQAAAQSQENNNNNNNNKITPIKLEKDKSNGGQNGDKSNPYTGAEFFDTMRRSHSISRQSYEAESNGSSGFSFNDTAKKEPVGKNTNHIVGSNDNSLKILYSQLNQQFPDENKFTSQLLKNGQLLNNSSAIKQIPVKRKV